VNSPGQPQGSAVARLGALTEGRSQELPLVLSPSGVDSRYDLAMSERSSTPSEAKASTGSAWVVVFVIGVLAVALGPPLYKDLRAASIRGHGNVHTGTVVSLVDTGDRFNDDPVVEVTVEVELEGRKVRGEVEDAISVVHLPRYQPGQRIKVWLDPAEPARMALEDGL
jgi:hypothetical protein